MRFLTDDERRAAAVQQDRYAAFKAEFIQLFQGRPNFKAPVIRIKMGREETTMAHFPAYVETYVDWRVPFKDIEAGTHLRPPVPQVYDFEVPPEP